MSKLHKISGCDDKTRRADVLFLHGLGGDALETWRYGEDESTSWPHWMGKEFPEVGVWSLGYAASPTKRLRGWRRLLQGFTVESSSIGHAMSLPDRAGQVLDRMVQKGFGHRPILLVCHSLGGLLAKQLLRKAKEADGPTRAIFDQVRAVLFLATPHAGTDLASLADAFRTVCGPTASMADLQAHDAHLRDLYNWYRRHSETAGIQTRTYFETKPYLGFKIVNETSANPGVGPDPVGLDENHLSIVKPRQANAQVCEAANILLRDYVLVLQQPGAMQSQRIPELPVSGSLTETHTSADPQVEGLETLRIYGDGFAGRKSELAMLDSAWADGAHVCVLYAEGGAGKTRVIVSWLNQMRDDGWRRAGRVFVHSFYSQGSDERQHGGSELVFQRALAFFGYSGPLIIDYTEQGRTLARLLVEQNGLLG